MAGTIYAAVWHPGSYGTKWMTSMDFDSFSEQVEVLHDQGWRLLRARSAKPGNTRRWSGLWRKGLKNSSRFSPGRSEGQLLAEHATQQQEGRRMIDVHAYVDGGKTRWTGVFLGGQGRSTFMPGLTWEKLKKETTNHHKSGWRLVRVQPYLQGGQQLFAALWKNGTEASFYNAYDFAGLGKAMSDKMAEGKHLVDVEPYWTAGGDLRYIGVWLSGASASIMRVVDQEGLEAVSRQHFAAGFRMQSLSATTYPCDCMNQAVMPAKFKNTKGQTITTGGYDYAITATATHCEGRPGTCSPPSAGASVFYRWPVDVDSKTQRRYLRVDSIAAPAQFLKLPFTDTSVKRLGIWRYDNGNWHHAGDYSRGAETFEIVASAAGRVIHIGWDAWSGNTIVVSHDVNGVEDAYRTIYMHLRNGASNDAAAAWDISVPQCDPGVQADYKDLLERTGIPKKVADRKPDAAYWGTDAEAIDQGLLSKKVKAGQFLAWAGNTGPGGQGRYGSPNTHLHIFWARRDPGNDRWYLFDPYGVYAGPACYPAEVTGSLGACARWGSAWKGGSPAYP